MQTENAEGLELCLKYCQVVFIHAFSLSVCAALCHVIIITIKTVFHSFKIDWNRPFYSFLLSCLAFE